MPKNFYPDTIYYFGNPIATKVSLKPEFKIERQVMRKLEPDNPLNKYITKDLQAPYIVNYLEEDCIFEDANGELLDGEYNFVLTCEENPLLLCGQNINHSSLANGKKVLGAGTLCFDMGLLTIITNNSGHYRPTDDELLPVIKALHTAGNGTLVKYKSYCNSVIATYPVVELLDSDFATVSPVLPNEDIIPITGERVKTGYELGNNSLFENHRFGRKLCPELQNEYSIFLQTGKGFFSPAEFTENSVDFCEDECIFNEKMTEILLIT